MQDFYDKKMKSGKKSSNFTFLSQKIDAHNTNSKNVKRLWDTLFKYVNVIF